MLIEYIEPEVFDWVQLNVNDNETPESVIEHIKTMRQWSLYNSNHFKIRINGKRIVDSDFGICYMTVHGILMDYLLDYDYVTIAQELIRIYSIDVDTFVRRLKSAHSWLIKIRRDKTENFVSSANKVIAEYTYGIIHFDLHINNDEPWKYVTWLTLNDAINSTTELIEFFGYNLFVVFYECDHYPYRCHQYVLVHNRNPMFKYNFFNYVLRELNNGG